MDENIKKQYSGMTKQQAKEEVRLLKKELKPLLRQVNLIEACLEYLNYKITDTS